MASDLKLIAKKRALNTMAITTVKVKTRETSNSTSCSIYFQKISYKKKVCLGSGSTDIRNIQ